jgi:IclR family acetate operon transcriptional repressor
MTDAVTPLRRRGRPPSAAEAGGEVQSLDRAIGILEVVAAADGLNLSEIARRTDLPTSTVHRLLATLQRRGLVAHEADSGAWTVGIGLFRIGAAYLRIRKLPEISRPVIRDLLREVEETVNVSMVDGNELVCVAQAESHAPMRAFFRIGRRMPIHASAAGKAILSAASERVREDLLSHAVLERFTGHTHTTRQSLEADLAKTAERGWAIDHEEHTPGMRCVSAPILDEWGEPIGALSISAPSVRMPAKRLIALGQRARKAADQLTMMFSGLRTHHTPGREQPPEHS